MYDHKIGLPQIKIHGTNKRRILKRKIIRGLLLYDFAQILRLIFIHFIGIFVRTVVATESENGENEKNSFWHGANLSTLNDR
jgi:hypothetical protein